MTYSRSCGVGTADCGATSCWCVSVDADTEIAPQEPVQRFDLSHECATCGSSAASCDQSPNGCCSSCSATGGCTHQPIADFGNDFPCCATPVQRAHNHSRED